MTKMIHSEISPPRNGEILDSKADHVQMTDLFFQVGSNLNGEPWGYAEARESGACFACGAISKEPVGEMTVQVAPRKRWPDAFGINKYRRCVIHERVVSGLLEAGVVIQCGPVVFKWLEGQRPPDDSVPKFFYIVPKPGLELDLAAGGVIADNRCPQCGAYRKIEFTKAHGRYAFVPKVETWTGLDIFTFSNFPGEQVYCSFRILELARKFRWANFQFHPLKLKNPTGKVPAKGIDYLSSTNWPPIELHSGH